MPPNKTILVEPIGCCAANAVFLDQFGRYSSDGLTFNGVVPTAPGLSLTPTDFWMTPIGGSFYRTSYDSGGSVRRSLLGNILASWAYESPPIANWNDSGVLILPADEGGGSKVFSTFQYVSAVTTYAFDSSTPNRVVRADFPNSIDLKAGAIGIGVNAPLMLVGRGGIAGWATGPYDGATIWDYAHIDDYLYDVAFSGTTFMAVGDAQVGILTVPLVAFIPAPYTGAGMGGMPIPPGFNGGSCKAVGGDAVGNFVSIGYVWNQDPPYDEAGVIWEGDSSIAHIVPGIFGRGERCGVAWSALLNRWMVVFDDGTALTASSPSGPWIAVTGAPVPLGVSATRPLRARL